jgi:C_GCAxxG_C_C family probable redox protein
MTTLFAGGLGGSHEEMCGALAGAIMVMSALLGRTSCQTDDKDAIALARRFRELFLAELGHTRCAPLRELARGPQGTGSCRPLVEHAATILLQLLDIE